MRMPVDILLISLLLSIFASGDATVSDRRILTPRGISNHRPCIPNEGFWFNKQPASIGVREGGRAFLECNVSNHCNIQFHWTLNDETISNTTRRYQNGSNLVITRVNRTLDNGLFHCIATMATTGLARQSTPATLSIWWISSNASVTLVSPSVSDIGAGKVKDIELRCIVDGYDDLTFSWFHNGRLLKSSAGKTSIDKRRLILHNVTVADNGVYSCTVDNNAGTVRSTENFVLSLPGEGIPKLVTTPVDHLAKIGSSFLFDCRYKDAHRVMWTKAQTRAPFTAHGRIRQLENDSLLFTDVKPEDEGAYECVGYGNADMGKGALGKSATSQGYMAWLTVAKLSPFESTSFEPVRDLYVAGHGKPFEVACTAPAGYPDPVVFWLRNGDRLPKSGRLRATEDLRLVIDSARVEDQGEYECIAENLAGRRRGVIRLYISKPPSIEYHPSSLDAEEGALAFFECKYKGNEYPVTTVDWELDGAPLQAQPKDPRIKVYPHNGTLVIDSVSMTDIGDYVCVVRTGDQKPVYSRAGKLTVREKLKFIPKPVDKKIELNNSTQIPCRAAGHIPPKVKWLKAGTISADGAVTKYAQPLTKFPDNIRDKNGTLYFHNTRFEDAGLYTCVAVSSQGYINETIKVEVFVYPTFKQAPRDEIVSEGSDAWFHCVVDGMPKPTAQWYFEQVPEAQWDKRKTKFIHYPNNTLQLKNVGPEQAGTYACLAGNRGGFKRQGAFLCVKLPNSNYSHCGRSLQLISPVVTPPGSSLDDQFRPSLEEAKRRQRDQGGGLGNQPFDSFGLSPYGGRRFGGGDETEAESDPSNSVTGVESGGLPMTTIAIACSAAAGYMFLVVCLVVYCAYRRRKQRDSKPADAAASAQLLQQQQQQQAMPLSTLGADAANGDAVCGSNYHGNRSHHHPGGRQQYSHPGGHKYQALGNGELLADGTPAANGNAYQQMTPRSRGSSSAAASGEQRSPAALSREQLQFVHSLGRGMYGDVYKMRMIAPRLRPASANSNSSSTAVSGVEEWIDVFVKAMTTTNEWAREEWQQEVKMYSKLDHPNITKLLGLCADAEPVYVVMEYSNYGNLKHYLYYSKLHKGAHSNGTVPLEYPPLLTAAQIVSICYDVAQAMDYLSNTRSIHKDLAARNVLLSPQYVAKVTHLGLSENQFANEYFSYQNRIIPVRWMPNEALFEDEWSMKSDVWSFGVFVWELFTVGDLPYMTMSNDEVVEALKRGDLRLLPPPNAPAVVRELMLKCSSADPRKRPTFAEIRETLGQLHIDSGL